MESGKIALGTDNIEAKIRSFFGQGGVIYYALKFPSWVVFARSRKRRLTRIPGVKFGSLTLGSDDLEAKIRQYFGQGGEIYYTGNSNPSWIVLMRQEIPDLFQEALRVMFG